MLLTLTTKTIKDIVDLEAQVSDLKSIYSSIVSFYQDPTTDIFEEGFLSGAHLMTRAFEYFSVIFCDIVTGLCQDRAIETLDGLEMLAKSNKIWHLFLDKYSLQKKSKIMVQRTLIQASNDVNRKKFLIIRFLLLNH